MIILSIMLQNRIVTNINNDWSFRFNGDLQGKYTRRVDFPHTWNANDTGIQDLQYRRALAVYQKNITFSKKDYENKRIFLKFDGVYQIADLLINNAFVGEHRGGYQAFTLEITNYIQLDKATLVGVHVNSAEQMDILPLPSTDFNFYGGIYRDVHLIVTEQSSFDLLDFGSYGIYTYQKNVTKNNAEVDVDISLNSLVADDFQVQISLYKGDELLVKQKNDVTITKDQLNKSILSKFNLQVTKPHLWDIDDPFLYKIQVQLIQNKTAIDNLTEKIGIRFFSVDPNEGFSLNGRHVKLTGATTHQERLGLGNALKLEHYQEDVKLIKELGFNSMRLIHYQHNQQFYNLCDENGITLITEIPFVGQGGYKGFGYINSQKFKDNAMQQLKELIKQNLNHPSVLYWGLYNELVNQEPSLIELLKLLNQTAHQLDPTRLTYQASNQMNPELNAQADLDLHNNYMGWYGGGAKELGKWMDTYHEANPKHCFGMSEYGAGGSIYHQQEQISKTVPTSTWHPENYQTYVIAENFKSIMERKYVFASYLHVFYDFAASHRTEGDQFGFNDKGLITYDRKVKKDSFYFIKANLNKVEQVLYLAERRMVRRSNTIQNFYIFTNQKQVDLYVNDELIQSQQPNDNKVANFTKVQLLNGANNITVKSANLTDYMELFVE